MNYLLVCIFLILPFCTLAQRAKLGLMGNLTAGADLIGKGFSPRESASNLISFNNNNAYFRFSTSVLYHEQFGIELAYQGNMNVSQNFNGFKSFMESRYAPSDYYIHYDESIKPGSSFNYLAEFIMVGPTCKFKYKKIHFIPKILIGGTGFTTTEAKAYIKKKDSNEYITEIYKQGNDNYSKAAFNINAGINILYFVYQGLAVNLELNYYEIKVNPHTLNYTVTTTNSIAGTTSVNNISYHQPLRQFSLGFGLCYYFKVGTRWQDQ